MQPFANRRQTDESVGLILGNIDRQTHQPRVFEPQAMPGRPGWGSWIVVDSVARGLAIIGDPGMTPFRVSIGRLA